MPATGSSALPKAKASLAAIAVCLSAVVALQAQATTKRTGSPKRRPASAGSVLPRGAHVIYLTAGTAYLGIGSAEGVRVGMSLPLRRNRIVVGECQVSGVAEHTARCPAVPTVRVGDTFAPPSAPQPSQSEAKPLPPLLAKDDQARAGAALTAAAFTPVPFNDTRTGVERVAPRDLRGEANAGLAFYHVNTQPNSNFTVLTVNAAVRGADLGAGFRTSIDLTVLSYLQRPPTNCGNISASGDPSKQCFRFPEQSSSQFFARQLEVSYRTPTSPLAFAGGRIWPYLAPSVGVLDGAQAGWHNAGNTLESGILGGTIPNGVTTAPTWNYPLFGAYLATTQASRESSSWFQGSAVVTARELPGLGWHYAVDALALWSLGKALDTSAEVRLGSGVLEVADHVEAATFDLNLRPSPRSQFSATLRYLNDALAGWVQPSALGPTNNSLRTNVSFFYDFEGVSALVLGMFDRDLLSGLSRSLAGGELTFPRLLAPTGLLSVGGDGSTGWYAGYDAYLQATLFPERNFQLVLRGTYFYSITQVVPTSPAEYGLSGTLDARLRISRAFSMQASLYVQAALEPVTDAVPVPLGINALVSATARF